MSRRSLLGGTGAAAAVIVGLGGAVTQSVAASTAAAASPNPASLKEVDPHASTGRRHGAPITGVANPRIRVLPLNDAKFRAGAFFDLRVEAAGVDTATARVEISVTGPHGPVPLLKGNPERTSSVPGSLEITYRHLAYPAAGRHLVAVKVTNGAESFSGSVVHEVVVPANNAGGRRAKNVIFFLGDGMGGAAITAARLLSKGITEGKYRGLLEMDQMDARGIVGTSGADSIATDSANSMSAYMTGHKSSVNAMGVYESNATDVNAHPRVETMAELLKRTQGKAIGVVTTAEVQDATPAAVFAHTRRRSEYIEIMNQALTDGQRPDVLLGGGLASLLPKSQPGSRRADERNLVDEFKALGYAYAQDRKQLQSAMSGRPRRLLGMFHTGNMNVYLDRQHTKKPEILGSWTDQPTLPEMTEAALNVLQDNRNGFFLMVEGASIDKQEHPLDGPRAVYDTIEFDQAIGVAKRWAARRDDTLIVVTADHNHSMSIIGTHDRGKADGRAGNGVYADAGFPTYVDKDGDGFPDDPNPDVQLFFGWSNHPDHADDFQLDPKPTQPALIDPATGKAVANPAHDPGAELQTGNLPFDQTNCVHTVEDVSIVASGPGAQRFNAFLDNTEVFHAIIDALGLDASK
ncbi:alkaline phosphatase [Dactylosporangium sp. NPDC048998]|uniref:alkaline phosphatase n=1 Tax=Dactylosporangium sp. NPDC048998 TaxID=3363976 RepID=UPI003711FEEE